MKKIVFILIVFFALFAVSASIPAKTDTDYDKALKYYYSGKYIDVVRILKDYIKNNPDPSAYYLIGYALYELKEYDEATGYFKQAYLVNPKFSPEIVSTAKKYKIKRSTKPSGKQVPSKKPYVSVSKEKQPETKQKAIPEKQPSKKFQPQKTQEQAVAPVQAPPLREPQKVEPPKSVQPPSGFPKFPEPEKGLPIAIPGGLAAFMAGFGIIVLIVAIALYVYYCLCLFLIAKMLNVTAPWTAWIPLVQFWPIVGSAGKPWWWILLLFIPIVNIFAVIYLWMCITENLSRNKWLGLLMLLPIINLVFLGILAFSKTEKPVMST